MNMMIVGSPGVGNNAPQNSSTASNAAISGTAPPPAHISQLTSAPVMMGSLNRSSTTTIPLGASNHRNRSVEHALTELQPAHRVSSSNLTPANFAASGPQLAGYASYSSQNSQQLAHVLTQQQQNTLTGASTVVAPTFGHVLPQQPSGRPVSNRPLHMPSGRNLSNGPQSRSTPPSRPASSSGRAPSSNSRSFTPSRSPQAGSSSYLNNQHQLPQVPQQPREVYAQRSIPLSPQRSNSRHRSQSSSRINYGNGSVSNLPMMAPSTIHQFANVNSPSLIPQQIPQFLPQMPIHLNAGSSTTQPFRIGSPPFRVGSPLENCIMPPNEYKKLTRPVLGNEEDGDHHDNHGSLGRRNLISPRHRERRAFFNHAALQDHNYCAAPPPSPPRSPTPPLSPYVSVQSGVSMGAVTQPQQQVAHNLQDVGQHQTAQDSFSFGIAGYKDGEYNKETATPDRTNLQAPQPPPVCKDNTSTIGAYPSPHYVGNNTHDPSPQSRLKQTIEEAGVGPMTPLGQEGSPLPGDKSAEGDGSPDSRPSPERDGGEETETAPEAEDEVGDDAVTRCICEYLHDDGYMIQCDKCSVWQHIVCMLVDKDNIPDESDEYLCEKCQPRVVDKKRAKALQKAREKEIFKTLPVDSSDEERKPAATTTTPIVSKGRKVGAKKAANSGVPAIGLKKTGPVLPEKKADKRFSKKPVKRRTLKESLAGLKSSSERKISPRKNQRRKSASATDIETEEENIGNDAVALRSWIDTYEEAVTNHYSPELRARLQGVKVPNTQIKPKDVSSSRCNVSLRGNGVKVLTANAYIPANTPIIECRGKYMLASQLSSRARNPEFVLLHKISSDLEVCVDCKTFGNDSRFCRRAESEATKSNAEVKHHLEKGSLHLYIVSTRTIDKNQEILLGPLESKVSPTQPQLSIQDELRQMKKVNGVIDEKKIRKSSSVKQRRLKREVKKEMCGSSSDEDIPVVRKTRSNVDKQKSTSFNVTSDNAVKKEVKVEESKDEKENKSEKENKIDKEDKNVKFEKKVKNEPIQQVQLKTEKIKQELKIEIKEEVALPPESGEYKLVTSPTQPVKQDAPLTPNTAAKSPGKPVLGLPDQSGLIIGVNTINYDVSLRNKSMSREEKKMEMILKAIAAMEKAESRKKHESSDSNERAPAKRRRSNSSKKDQGDSNLESSCDETALENLRPERTKSSKGKRKRNISLRRRSRAKSGDSTSAFSADESATTPNIEHESSSTPGDGAPFKFPFKKQQDGDDIDDDVSGHYIRGSKSPPGIANHLLRSAVTNNAGMKSPTKSIGCSAKKRWLRAAMSEDHNEEAAAPCSAAASPAAAAATSPGQEPDYTPLKKRRLATYNESNEEKESKSEQDGDRQEEKSSKAQVTEKIKSLPNGLKKRLISNLLLNAVLDKAMQDILPDDDIAQSPIQDTNDEHLVTEELVPEETVKQPETPKKKSRNLRKGGKGKKSEDILEENGLEAVDRRENMKTGTIDKEDDKDKNVKEVDESAKPGKSNKSSAAATSFTSSVTASSSIEKPSEPDPDKPPTPIQHSVFKSFFSTDLSIDDIDRQIEAKRVELARENSLVSSLPSPRLDFSDDLPLNRTSLRQQLSVPAPNSALAGTENSQSSHTPQQSRKKVSIADYKKRKQASQQQVGQTETDSSASVSTISSLLSTNLTSLPPVSLPDLPGLASSQKQKSASLFQPKRTRSNSPLSNDKKNDKRSSTPQESKTVNASPMEKRGVSPAKIRERSSPRRNASSYLSSSQKSERWDSKSNRDSHKGLKHSSPLLSSKRVPAASSVPCAPNIPPIQRQTIHTPDMPREDLTERLRKEFGLNVEDSDGEDGSDSENSGGGADYPLRRMHNGPERTNGWRDEKGGFWGGR